MFLVSPELNHAREMIERAEFVYILKAAGETRDLKSDSPSASRIQWLLSPCASIVGRGVHASALPSVPQSRSDEAGGGA